MLGVAVDNSFATNHFIYLFYTFDKFGGCEFNTPTSAVNRVSRFVLGDNDVIQPSSETVLIDNIPSPSATHNGGDLQVGKDGNLYVSVGDGGCDFRGDSGCGLANDAARDLGGLSGKILRITGSGGIPADNPFQGAGTARCNVTGSTTTTQKCREIWTHRHAQPVPHRSRPELSATTKFYANDVGGTVWEEIDVLASGGRLRMAGARGPLRGQLEHQLRAAAGRDDEPDLRLQPLHRLRVDHAGRVRPDRHLARRSTTTPTCSATTCAARSGGSTRCRAAGFAATEFATFPARTRS